MTFALLIAFLATSPSPARGETLTTVNTMQRRAFVSPGARFGDRSQELSLVLGSATVFDHLLTQRSHPLPRDAFPGGGEWRTLGVRVDLINSHWSPAAVHGLAFFSIGGWGFELWPSGLE